MRRIAGHPQDRIHKQPVINPAPARRSLPPRQIPRNPLPLRVRQHPSAQSPSPSTTLMMWTPLHRPAVVMLLVDHPKQEEERSEEHTSELQSLMRISYAVFCLKKQTTPSPQTALSELKQ